MSRRTDLLRQLIRSDKFGEEKTNEQKFLAATAELILTDMINIAINGFLVHGPGTLIINLLNDSTTYMGGHQIEEDLRIAEANEDEDIVDFLRDLMKRIDENNWTDNVLLTLISDAGSRTFSLEAGRSQESLREVTAELTE